MMSRSGTVSRFLDVLSYQVLAIRNYLRHFKKGVHGEFLPDEVEVQSDWERNTFSLVFLVGPAFEFMESSRKGASAELLKQIQLNMSRLKVVHHDLSGAYLTYCRHIQNASGGLGFRSARPWLLSDVEHAIFRCDKWLERIYESQSGDSLLQPAALDQDALALWRDLSAADVPKDLAGLENRVAGVDRIISQIKASGPSDEAFASAVLAENSLLQLCMASRRLIVTMFFLLLTRRHDVTVADVVMARDSLQRASDVFDGLSGMSKTGLGKVADDGIRLLRERLEILCRLSEPESIGDESDPAVKLLVAENKASKPESWDETDRLLLAADRNQAAV